MAELQGLQLNEGEFARRNTDIIAVSVDPVATNAEAVRDLGAAFHILSDPEMKVIDTYGLRHREGHEGEDVARPASFLIDDDGVVIWRNLAESIRVRPRPEDILAVIDGQRG